MQDNASLSADERWAVIDTLHKFYSLVDSGRADEAAELFTDDARLEFGPGSPAPGVTQGAAVKDSLKARAAMKNVTTRHVISNIALRRNPDGSVTSEALLTLFRSDNGVKDPAPLFVCDLEETLVSAGAGWKFRERKIIPVFVRAKS